MANLLDLRRSVVPPVKVVYKTVVARRPWYVEIMKIFMAVAIVGAIVWGISKADEIVGQINEKKSVSFSAIGAVSDVSTTTLSITHASGFEGVTDTNYSFDVTNVKKIETNEYVPLSLSDIKLGDTIIVQGLFEKGLITANRIISFMRPVEIATTTATSTPEEVATTTPEIATSTPEIATTTPDIATSTPPQEISTSTESVATTTPEAIILESATTTPDIATSTESTATTSENQ